jgi:hypothetical protein
LRAHIVDEAVEPAVLRRHRRNLLHGTLHIRHIEGRGRRGAAFRAHARRRRFGARAIAPIDDDVSAGLRQGAGHLEAEAARGAGQQNDMAREIESLRRGSTHPSLNPQTRARRNALSPKSMSCAPSRSANQECRRKRRAE